MSLLRLLILLIILGLLAACATTPSGTSTRTGVDRVSPIRGAEINTRLGIGYLERGQLQIAMEKLQLALQHDPDHVPAHLTLALIHEQIGDEQNARRHYRQAARLAPNDGGTQNAYGAFLCRLGQYAEADQRFMTATRDPFYATPELAWTNAGACARRAGDLERANEYLRQALEHDAEYPDPLYHLAEIYYQQGEAFRARAFLQRYEAFATPEAAALWLGFRIENQLGNVTEANQYASRLDRNFPDSDQARELRRQQQRND
jgi:type IV pilus assembly protein PilF